MGLVGVVGVVVGVVGVVGAHYPAVEALDLRLQSPRLRNIGSALSQAL